MPAPPAEAMAQPVEQSPVDASVSQFAPQQDTAVDAVPEPAVAAETGATGVDPVSDEDWLDRICPYLLSEDGSWRSTQADEGHRCTAQDPPGTLPAAFQERFCLTDRHVRCEMYKYAQGARSAALEQEGIPADQVEGARFKPSVRSVPLALGPSDGGRASGGRGSSDRRPLWAALGIGGFVLFIILVVFLSGGSGDSGTEPGASASAAPQTTAQPTPTLMPTPQPTPEQTAAPGETPGTTTAPIAARDLVRYEVQEGEALKRIGEIFGVSRQRIIRANEGMAVKTPYVVAGDIILVPLSADVPEETIMELPGYIELIRAE